MGGVVAKHPEVLGPVLTALLPSSLSHHSEGPEATAPCLDIWTETQAQ